jgi:hypothetical protein
VELLATLRLLWLRRRAVAVGLVVAVAAAVLLARGGVAPGGVGAASASVMLDTPQSQLLAVQPKGSETLPTRTLLFADMMGRDDVRAEVARAAGVAPADLDILPPTARQEAPVSTPLVDQASDIAASTRAPNVVNVYADGLTPMVTIDAQAADKATALALVNAATKTLTGMLEKVSPGQPSRFDADVVTAPHAKTVVTTSHRPIMAAIAAFMVFLAWLGAILVGSGLARWLRGGVARPA